MYVRARGHVGCGLIKPQQGLIDSGLPVWEGCRESRRCSRDTYPESYITKFTSIRRKLLTYGGHQLFGVDDFWESSTFQVARGASAAREWLGPAAEVVAVTLGGNGSKGEGGLEPLGGKQGLQGLNGLKGADAVEEVLRKLVAKQVVRPTTRTEDYDPFVKSELASRN